MRRIRSEYCKQVAWHNDKMKTVPFDAFDLGGLVVRSADRNLFVITHYWRSDGFTHIS